MTRHAGDAEVAAALEEQIRRARLIMIASMATYARLCLERKFLDAIDKQEPAGIPTPRTQKEWLSHIILKQVRCGATFHRQQVLVWAGDIIRGRTPGQTISRLLQDLRDEGSLEFVDNNGTYRRLR